MEEVLERFAAIRPSYERFREKISDLINELLKSEKVDLVSTESRTKSIDSFKEKINRKGKKYKDPINEITDLCGLRLITYYTEDIFKIADVLEKEFKVDKENSIDKTKIENPDRFGYQSLHYILTINSNRNSLAEWKPFKDFKIEVQIRSILQHSWAAIDHKLRYKTKGEIPSSLQRKIFRLSALLELADEEFLSIKNETIKINAEIDESIEKGNLNIELNSLSIISYLTNNHRIDDLVKLAEKVGFGANPFKDRNKEVENLGTFVSRLIGCIELFNLKSIQDLDVLLNQPDQIIKIELSRFITEFKKISTVPIYAVKSDIVLILIVVFTKIDMKFHEEKLKKIVGWELFYNALINVKNNKSA